MRLPGQLQIQKNVVAVDAEAWVGVAADFRVQVARWPGSPCPAFHWLAHLTVGGAVLGVLENG